MSTRPEPFEQRGERKPLGVRVLTEPRLPGCWSTNVSPTGMGLVAQAASPSEGPQEGEEVALEWTLPGVRTRIRVRGEVRWRHDGERSGPEPSTALGVQFLRFEGEGRVKLTRYLETFRPRVVVSEATPRAMQLLRAALGEAVELSGVASPGELEEALGRGDAASLVVCGLKGIEQALASGGAPPEAAPPLIFWAPARPERLVELFNQGRLFRALAPDCGAAALRDTVLGACREHGARLERRRIALELERHLLLRERARRSTPPRSLESAPGLQSPAMGRVMALVRLVAPHRVPVLLQGETGTGKEVLARTLHRLGPRASHAFVVQDCGALPETLLESELFGHVKGAFTGATADHPGLFVLADGGTIFLDEIENTTVALQAKLLRVIETGEVRPVGGAAVRQVDVRIIAASNRVLEDEVQGGRLRSDLFFRLNTFVVDLPPLRARVEDILPLAWHFIDTFNRTLDRRVHGLSKEAEALLLRLEWRGNVRELRNVMERAVLLSGGDGVITPSHFPDALVARAAAPGGGTRGGRGFAERIAEAERQILREALERNGGVLRRAARELQMDPVTLGRRARRQGLWGGRGRP